MWRTDKPENIGDYIILVPEVIGPITDFPQRVSGSISYAWFDGEVFIMSAGVHVQVGFCAWTKRPGLLFTGFGIDGPQLEVLEVKE